jgi:CubicO group peptidase (beta-lactamase class C family)
MPFGSLSDWDRMVAALAKQEPAWQPGTAHGYHGVTYGHLVGEVLRQATGATPGALLAKQLAGPLGADLHLGLPERADGRTARMVLAPIQGGTFFDHWKPDGLGPRSFGNPPDCNDVEHTNSRAFRQAEIPAANLHGSARGLERVYALLARGGEGMLSAELVEEAGKAHVTGHDMVMDLPTSFGLGFERTIPEWRFGPGERTFGHNGSGGSLGFVDPDAGISFGYVMNKMTWGPTRDDPRWPSLFDAVYAAL